MNEIELFLRMSVVIRKMSLPEPTVCQFKLGFKLVGDLSSFYEKIPIDEFIVRIQYRGSQEGPPNLKIPPKERFVINLLEELAQNTDYIEFDLCYRKKIHSVRMYNYGLRLTGFPSLERAQQICTKLLTYFPGQSWKIEDLAYLLVNYVHQTSLPLIDQIAHFQKVDGAKIKNQLRYTKIRWQNSTFTLYANGKIIQTASNPEWAQADYSRYCAELAQI